MAQQFRTKFVGQYQPAMYQLSIRNPNQGFIELATYTFPLTPTQLRVERSSLSSYSETQGPSSSQGVTRIVDTYGLAPPVFIIEGTTGWDLHASDGYVLTGLMSIQLLQKFLARYVELNQAQRENGNPDLLRAGVLRLLQRQLLAGRAGRPARDPPERRPHQAHLLPVPLGRRAAGRRADPRRGRCTGKRAGDARRDRRGERGDHIDRNAGSLFAHRFGGGYRIKETVS